MALLIAHTFSRTTGGTRCKPYVVRVWYNIHINACPCFTGARVLLPNERPSSLDQAVKSLSEI